jgi:hypothetical protein
MMSDPMSTFLKMVGILNTVPKRARYSNPVMGLDEAITHAAP